MLPEIQRFVNWVRRRPNAHTRCDYRADLK
jgi:hypothetical protein